MRCDFRSRLSTICLAACLLGAPAVQARTVLAAVPISRMDLSWWRHRYDEKLAALHNNSVDLVWLGDSITEDWEKPEFQPAWQRFYGDRHAINLGFIGDTTSSVLWRIEHGEASGISPKVVILLIGANNMGRPHWSAADTVQGIDAIIAQLRARLPNTKILLLSVLPSERTAWITATTAEINHMLDAKYAEQRAPGVTYLDVTRVFMKNGRLDTTMFLDPTMHPPEPALHPDAEAQARMAAAIEPTLAALMGDRNHLQR